LRRRPALLFVRTIVHARREHVRQMLLRLDNDPEKDPPVEVQEERRQELVSLMAAAVVAVVKARKEVRDDDANSGS
jgi:hypothetical protein